MKVRDYFAELYVAGRFADEGWDVYFPHRDQGFDFIVSRWDADDKMQRLRPVQVKGKFPAEDKGDQEKYGFVGTLTQLHPDMVLAMPFFASHEKQAPIHIAYLPLSVIHRSGDDHRCHPARFRNSRAEPRPHYANFFDQSGISLTKRDDWSTLTVERGRSILLDD